MSERLRESLIDLVKLQSLIEGSQTLLITKKIMLQYEEIRKGGECNMIKYQCVRESARKKGFKELMGLSLKRYRDLLSNWGEYMQKYKIPA